MTSPDRIVGTHGALFCEKPTVRPSTYGRWVFPFRNLRRSHRKILLTLKTSVNNMEIHLSVS